MAVSAGHRPTPDGGQVAPTGLPALLAMKVEGQERVIGSVCRECLDHMIILNEDRLRRILKSYCQYYHNARPHLSLDCNAPTPRRVEPPSQGEVISTGQVGGLYHRYSRAA
jgi:hypothetical protein